MSEDIRMEPVFNARDDVPTLRNEIEPDWSEFERVQPVEPSAPPAADSVRLQALEDLAGALAPKITENVQKALAPLVEKAVANAALHLKGELAREIDAHVVRCVQEQFAASLQAERDKLRDETN